jgi:protein involved in polysaccharide export with SLBB domain
MKGMRIADLLSAAGGLEIAIPKNEESTVQVSGKSTTANIYDKISISGLSKVILERVDRETGAVERILVDINAIIVLGDETKNIELMPGDSLTFTAWCLKAVFSRTIRTSKCGTISFSPAAR